MAQVRVTFWGVRGSVPTPLTSADIEKKIELFLKSSIREQGMPLTYGGNTSCVEVRYGNHLFVLDMGTGLRSLGNALFHEMMRKSGIKIHFFLSHVHWDHIQGLPFFGPLYVNKETGILNDFCFYGGTAWQETAETVLRGQMDSSKFPVSFKKILKMTNKVSFCDLYDMMNFKITDNESDFVRVKFRELDHPQETYGIRMEFPNGKVLAYTTDNEPRDPREPDPRLVSLAKNADLWITDCQYTHEIYHGKNYGGFQRYDWGHSYPEAVAETARVAQVKQVILFHHDPGSSDEKIFNIEQYTRDLLKGSSVDKVQAAWEGLQIQL